MSLADMTIPEVPGLTDGENPIVVNKEQAVILGKALFWDINVGSDGIACASCHFHAGADSRTQNQLSPGGVDTAETDRFFDMITSDGQPVAANYQLRLEDFPLHQRENPLDHTSAVTRDSDDVVSSAGTFGGTYRRSRSSKSDDICSRAADSVFHVYEIGTRRVEPRNTPTIINAVFNHRSFWDGRAAHVFNGSSSWGERDADAGIWEKTDDGQIVKRPLRLKNSSLASLALTPPLSSTEMSCNGRTFADIGRKLLRRVPLERQKVHYLDSVLGPLSNSTQEQQSTGLKTRYRELIKRAFHKKLWSYWQRGAFGQPLRGQPYSHIEANFGLFFALSIQLYQATLVSDQSPFDLSARNEDGVPVDLSPAAQHGFELFRENQCAHCHIGPNFTMASVAANAEFALRHPEAFGDSQSAVSTTTNVVSRTLVSNGVAFFDTGFAATGVTAVTVDRGLGGNDPFGRPLAYSKQYLQWLAGRQQQVFDSEVYEIRPCDFQEAFAVNFNFPFPQQNMFTLADGIRPQMQVTTDCFNSGFAYLPTVAAARAELDSATNQKMLHAVEGAFKIPTLRNVELTGPYMHNGGMATLEEVVEFYARGGNFSAPAKQTEKVFPLAPLRAAQNRADLVTFLKTLTDERVRYEQAPFDHPEIMIPNGHIGDHETVTGGHPLAADLAKDQWLLIDAVGAPGRNEPLLPFVDLLPE